MIRRLLAGFAISSLAIIGAAPVCPAGISLGTLQLTVKRTGQPQPIPLTQVNRLQPGDEILYAPVLRGKEKRSGKVTAVIVEPTSQDEFRIRALQPESAEKPAHWAVPSRGSIVVFVYGPGGFSNGKVERFLGKNNEMVAQLADYAEKTAQTEAVLQILAANAGAGASDNLNAALEGFAAQYGLNNKIDRTAPPEERTLAFMRSLNPALSAYDPVSAAKPQRISGATGLATTVAGMFLGSPVGLAAGGTAMALNLKTLLFPNTDFRSSFAQPAYEGVSLCGRQDGPHGRTRLAYLWAVRLPDTAAPSLALASSAFIPAGFRTPVEVHAPDKEWQWIHRVRDWKLEQAGKPAVPVPVMARPDKHALEIDLTKANVSPGTYTLAGRWDWQDIGVPGEITVAPLSSFGSARLSPSSQGALIEHRGKRVVHLEGDDFQFVEKAEIVRRGDKYASPLPVRFSLAKGLRGGVQHTMELQVDTTPLDRGDYVLRLTQADGHPRTVDVKVVPEPPRIANLPLRVNAGEQCQAITLTGERLDNIETVHAEGLNLTLKPAERPDTRTLEVAVPAEAKPGTTVDLRLTVRDRGEPVVLDKAIVVAAARPRIVSASIALPADLPIELRQGDLPAGVALSAVLKTEGLADDALTHISCAGTERGRLSLRAGGEQNGAKARWLGTDSLFISFDPGAWPSGCAIRASVENPATGTSDNYELGRVIRMPRIDSFQLTSEAAPDGGYIGVLVGRDLEEIERTGWDAATAYPVLGLPTAAINVANRQSLRIRLPWPSPAPHSAIVVWLRGDTSPRKTTLTY